MISFNSGVSLKLRSYRALSGLLVSFLVIAVCLICNAEENKPANPEKRVDHPGRVAITLAFVGDIFLGNWAEAFIDSFGTDYPFRGCDSILQSVDLAVGNLESPITVTGEPIVDKQYLLRSPPGIENGLAGANLRMLNLANNHILDYGFEGLKNTIRFLSNAGIRHFGAGLDAASAYREAVFEKDGISVAFIGFSATFPEEYWASDSTGGTAFPYEKELRISVERCVGTYDFVAVSFHWSAEKLEYPKDYQIDLAHTCIDLGADLVVGHHPHVAQGIEVYHGVPIFYSLGNFAFASYSESARQGLMAEVGIERDGKLGWAGVIPINVYNAERNFQPVPLEGLAKDSLIDYLNTISFSLNDSTSVLNKDGTVTLREQK